MRTTIQTFQEAFSACSDRDDAIFIPFVVAGDPDFETSLEIVQTMVEAGADALEIGFPFSDPVADGPTIQSADIRALNSGMSVKKGFEFIKRIREFTLIPIGLLVYYNLIYKLGVDEFYYQAKKSGVNAILVADLPPEEAHEALKASKIHNLDQIFMVAQTTNNKRIKHISKMAKGFIYVVAVMGVTGARSKLDHRTGQLIQRVRANSELPICVGFGISTAEHAQDVKIAGANGVIVASALIDLVADNLKNKQVMLEKINNNCREIKEAIQGGN